MDILLFYDGAFFSFEIPFYFRKYVMLSVGRDFEVSMLVIEVMGREDLRWEIGDGMNCCTLNRIDRFFLFIIPPFEWFSYEGGMRSGYFTGSDYDQSGFVMVKLIKRKWDDDIECLS
ncbi:hypothetical protein EYC80_004679 [Monilinia laxa]|uniref:Uncharacterized protein n=1 Tax=Monilinia laxa TaxID=61186 RepID=A0A5N6KHP9_MONLA|nr:hypothetical protein EYC80_004679 [Monilinia laxa]